MSRGLPINFPLPTCWRPALYVADEFKDPFPLMPILALIALIKSLVLWLRVGFEMF
jgi:hypothetical protein